MTTITIERELLEQALEALDNSVDVVYEEYTDAVHRYANIPSRKARLDGLAAMAKAHLDTSDAIRAALAAPATAPERPNPYDACESFKAYQLSCRREAVLQKEIERLLAAPATAPDRHAQELLTMEVALQIMQERHAQELCAYSVTVDKLRAERKPMTPKQIYQICPELCNDEAIVEFARRIELHHGIGDKP